MPYVDDAEEHAVRRERDQFEIMAWPRAAPGYFNNRKVSIYGGSNEIQRNIIAKAVLGF